MAYYWLEIHKVELQSVCIGSCDVLALAIFQVNRMSRS